MEEMLHLLIPIQSVHMCGKLKRDRKGVVAKRLAVHSSPQLRYLLPTHKTRDHVIRRSNNAIPNFYGNSRNFKMLQPIHLLRWQKCIFRHDVGGFPPEKCPHEEHRGVGESNMPFISGPTTLSFSILCVTELRQNSKPAACSFVRKPNEKARTARYLHIPV